MRDITHDLERKEKEEEEEEENEAVSRDKNKILELHSSCHLKDTGELNLQQSA